jgi:catechol 2,3-dioxygenase-like lactoylglutathione lyase family enzyme
VAGPFAVVAFDHVQLAIPVGGEERCRAFWGGILGMSEIEKPPALVGRGGCWFRTGDAELHLGVETPFAPSHKAHPCLRVRGLAAAAEALAAAGCPVTWDAAVPHVRRLFTADPFGNRLELLEPAG